MFLILNRLPIGRHNQCALCEKAFYCLIVCTFVATSIAGAFEFFKGTYFVVNVEADYVVAAIDSRLSSFREGNITAFRDNYCKILPLGDIIFFAEGDYGAEGPFGFDGYDIARSNYGRPNLDLRQLASNWADEMVGKVATFAAYYPNAFADRRDSDNIIQGIFIAYENSSDAHVVRAAIERRMDRTFTPSLLEIPGAIPITQEHGLNFTPGHKEILDEFIPGRESGRAKAMISETPTAGNTRAEIGALKAERYVKAVANWISDNRTGGEIASVIFERGQKWRWYHRPSFCPEK